MASKNEATTQEESANTILPYSPSMYYEVFFEDLEDAIIGYYRNSEYSYIFDQELDEDAPDENPILFNVRKRTLAATENKEILDFIADEPYNNITQLLLEDLANQGKIEEGDYLVFMSRVTKEAQQAAIGQSRARKIIKDLDLGVLAKHQGKVFDGLCEAISKRREALSKRREATRVVEDNDKERWREIAERVLD